MKALGSAAAFQAHRQQHERSKPFDLGFLILEPFEQSEGEVEDVDALFLLQRSGVVPDVEQPLLQRLGRQPSLQPRFRRPGLRVRTVPVLSCRRLGRRGRDDGRRGRSRALGLRWRLRLRWQEGEALAFLEEFEQRRRARAGDLDGPDVLGLERDVHEPIARAQIEQRAPVRQQSVAYGCSCHVQSSCDSRIATRRLRGQALDTVPTRSAARL